jgi:hypothetical protein
MKEFKKPNLKASERTGPDKEIMTRMPFGVALQMIPCYLPCV